MRPIILYGTEVAQQSWFKVTDHAESFSFAVKTDVASLALAQEVDCTPFFGPKLFARVAKAAFEFFAFLDSSHTTKALS